MSAPLAMAAALGAQVDAPRLSRRKLRAKTLRGVVLRQVIRHRWRVAMRKEKVRVTFHDFLVAIGARPKALTQHEADKRKPAERWARSLRKGAGGLVGYQPAVKANEYVPRGERKDDAKPSLVLLHAEAACNLQPFAVRHAALMRAEAPPKDVAPWFGGAMRVWQNARRKTSNRRKARRGWR